MHCTEVRVSGKTIEVPSIRVNDKTIIVGTGWHRTATIQDEEFLDGEAVDDPEQFVAALKQSDLKANIFTFWNCRHLQRKSGETGKAFLALRQRLRYD